MMELADVTDSKSVGSDTVRVQVPLPAPYADMAELADALDSGSSECKFMQVQVLLSAPKLDTNFDTMGIAIGVQFFCRITKV